MTAFLSTVSNRLADRFLGLASMPTLAWIGVAILTVSSSAGLAARVRKLGEIYTSNWTGSRAPDALPAVLVVVCVSVIVAYSVVVACRRILVSLWVMKPRGILRILADWRIRRWDNLARLAKERLKAQNQAQAEYYAIRRNKIALARPARHSWIGDRVAATDLRLHNTYGLDIDAAWPTLWLLFPADVRTELEDARTKFVNATSLLAWTLPFIVLAAAWPPALFVALFTSGFGWIDSRRSAATLAEYIEASVEIHLKILASSMGVEIDDGKFTTHTGHTIMARIRKGI